MSRKPTLMKRAWANIFPQLVCASIVILLLLPVSSQARVQNLPQNILHAFESLLGLNSNQKVLQRSDIDGFLQQANPNEIRYVTQGAYREGVLRFSGQVDDEILAFGVLTRQEAVRKRWTPDNYLVLKVGRKSPESMYSRQSMVSYENVIKTSTYRPSLYNRVLDGAKNLRNVHRGRDHNGSALSEIVVDAIKSRVRYRGLPLDELEDQSIALMEIPIPLSQLRVGDFESLLHAMSDAIEKGIPETVNRKTVTAW